MASFIVNLFDININNIKKNTFQLIKNKKVKTPFSDCNLTNYSRIHQLFKFIKKMKRNHLFDHIRTKKSGI